MATVNTLEQLAEALKGTAETMARNADMLEVISKELLNISKQGGFERFAQEQPFEETKPAETKAEKVTLEDLRKFLTPLAAQGKEVNKLIHKFGYKKLSEMPESIYEEVLETAKKELV